MLILVLVAVGWWTPAPDLAGDDGPEAPAAYYLTGTEVTEPGSDLVSVVQEDKSFHPDLASVSVGGTIELPNRDATVHNVYSPEGGAMGFFDLGSAEQTEPDGSNLLSKEMTDTGVVELTCAVHPVMEAKVFVVPSRFHTVSDDGTYEFSDVPSGEYDLMVMKGDGSVSQLKTVQID